MTVSLRLRAILISAALGSALLTPALAGAEPAPGTTPAPNRAAPKSCDEARFALAKAKQAVKRAKKSGSKKALKRAKRKRAAAKLAISVYCDPSTGDGTGGGTGDDTGTGGPTPAVPGGPTWSGGRYQGTYAENSVDLAFNVRATRLYTGPFDAFYVDVTCQESDPDYTGPNQIYTTSSAIEPVEATISNDGSFSGSGVYVPGPGSRIPWTISGQISGQSITGATFSVDYTDPTGDPCEGSMAFTANWYGDYEL